MAYTDWRPATSGYQAILDGGTPFPHPPTGTALTSGEIAQCAASDNSWLQVTATYSASWPRPCAFLWFDFSDLPALATIAHVAVQCEGHNGRSGSLYHWVYLNGAWTLCSYLWDWHDADDFTSVLAVSTSEIEDDGGVWVAIAPQDPSGYPSYFWPWPIFVDQVLARIQYDSAPASLSSTPNLFAQRFRLFDNATAGEISFERRDTPSGAWSTPSQPFSDPGCHSPNLEVLPDGVLRAVLVSSSGSIVAYRSYNDGDTWSAE